MSKNLLKIASVFFIGAGVLVSAQDTKGKVGINTENPSATLNVKSLTGKNASTKNFELENASSTKMVTVLDNGKVGVNTENPSTLMELTGLDNSYNSNMIYFNSMRNGKTDPEIGYMDSGIALRRLRGSIKSPESVAIGENLGGLSWVPYVDTKGVDYDTGSNFRITTSINSSYMGIAKDKYNKIKNTSALVLKSSLSADEDFRGLVVNNLGYVGINTQANKAGFLPAENALNETLTVNGAIKVGNRAFATDGTSLPKYTTLGSTPSVPRGGAGTFIYDDTNNHFYGYVGGVNKWVQLDNEASSSEVKVPNNKTLKCNASNAGIINFGDVTVGGKSIQAFGFCMKDSSDKYRWFYIYGASNVTSGEEGDFGAGL